MNDRPKDDFRDDEGIGRSLRDLPPVEADAAFRDRLRQAFVSGAIDESAPGETVHRLPRPRRAGTSLRWAVVAAALVVIAAVAVLNRAPATRVLETAGTGNVVIDGVPVPIDDAKAIERRIRPGATVVVPDGGRVDLVIPKVAAYELASGTHATLPAEPGRWFGRDTRCTLSVGEIRFESGPGFHGNTLTVHTPEGMAVITGTQVSVQRGSGGTCVCVLKGTVEVGVKRSALEAIPPGKRMVMSSSGGTQVLPILPLHRQGVLDFIKRVGDRFPAGGSH